MKNIVKKVIVFDTNVLLDLYCVSKENAEEFIDFFKKCDFDLYISEFVYNEFLKNYQNSRKNTGGRNRVFLFKKVFDDKYDSVHKMILSIKENNLYKGYNSNITLETEEFISTLEKYKNNINSEIQEIEKQVDFDYQSDDPVLEFVQYITRVFSFKKYSQTDKIHNSIIAEQRFKLGIKPGLTDQSKDKDPFSKYNDTFIWLDLLDVAVDYDQVIFLENEKKEDWWDVSQIDCAASLVRDWNDKFGETKSFRMLPLVSFLSENYDYIDSDALLQLKDQTEKLNNDIENFTMCNELILEKISDLNIEFENHLLGMTLKYGTIADITDAEPIENPIFIFDGASSQFDSFDKTLTVDLKVKFLYEADAEESYGRDLGPSYYKIGIEIILGVELTFAVLLDRDIDYELTDFHFDYEDLKFGIDIVKDYSECIYDDEEFCPSCGELITNDNYNMNGTCKKCNS